MKNTFLAVGNGTQFIVDVALSKGVFKDGKYMSFNHGFELLDGVKEEFTDLEYSQQVEHLRSLVEDFQKDVSDDHKRFAIVDAANKMRKPFNLDSVEDYADVAYRPRRMSMKK